MEAKIEKISELSKLLSVKTRVSDDSFHIFGKFSIGHLLSRLSLEKYYGVSASELILSLCLFRIVDESLHSVCKHKIYELSNHGKNCFYRMMIRRYIQLSGHLGDIPVRIFLVKYGRNSVWNVLLATDTTMSFVKAFEVYQIRWNIEVMDKETLSLELS